MGIILGYVKACTNSLKSTIILHIAFNSSSFFIAIIVGVFGNTVSTALAVFGIGLISLVKGVMYIAHYEPIAKV